VHRHWKITPSFCWVWFPNSLDEIVAAMAEAKIAGSRTAMWRFYERHGVTF
jgi:hypothetical protein